jgi:hypothetical protein
MDRLDINFYGTGELGIKAGVFTGTDRVRQDVDLATVLLNYRWGGPVIEKKDERPAVSAGLFCVDHA